MTAAPDTVALPRRELTGPSALGRGLQRFWSLLWLSALADFKRRYAGTVLGYAWTLIRPLMTLGIFYVVVTQILFRFEEIPNYGVLLLLNIVLFTFFTEATIGATRSFVAGGGLVRKMPVPRIVMPLSTVLTISFSLGTNLIVVFVWMLAAGVEPRSTWLLLPAILVPLVVLTCCTSLLLSALFPRFRDVAQVWPIATRIMFYTTVIFPIEFLPRVLQDVQSFNPVAPLFVQVRSWMIDSDAPGWFDLGRTTFQELMPFAVFISLCVAGWLVFAHRAPRIAEEL
jgi:ABC-2 type transport system permease protein